MPERADVLLISPDSHLRALLTKWLEDLGHVAWVAADLRQCTDLVAELRPDLILCDLLTHPARHVEALRRELGEHRVSTARVLALVESFSSGAIEDALEAGADDWLVWPCTRQALGARLAVHARESRMREALQCSAAESHALTQQRERMLSMFTHDLKSPLTIILGHLQLLEQEKMGALPTDEARRAVRGSVESAQRLVRRIDDFLTVNSALSCAEQMHRRVLSLADLVTRWAEDHRDAAALRGLVVATNMPEGPCEIEADEALLTRAVENLIGNALKYTPEGGTIEIGAALDGDCARVWVRDNGPGIAAEECARIFDPFHRSRLSARGVRGVGLGLSVVRSIAEAHGGRAQVASEPGVGSCFTIALPLRAGALTHRRALIVEDNIDFARVMALALRLDGIASTICATAEEALESVRQQRPDLITLDLMLPDLPGWQLLDELERELDGEQVPVLVLSASERRLRVIRGDERVQICLAKDDFDQAAFREAARQLLRR